MAVTEEVMAQAVTPVVAAAQNPPRNQPLAEAGVEATFVPFLYGAEASGSVPERCLQFLSFFVEKKLLPDLANFAWM